MESGDSLFYTLLVIYLMIKRLFHLLYMQMLYLLILDNIQCRAILNTTMMGKTKEYAIGTLQNN